MLGFFRQMLTASIAAGKFNVFISTAMTLTPRKYCEAVVTKQLGSKSWQFCQNYLGGLAHGWNDWFDGTFRLKPSSVIDVSGNRTIAFYATLSKATSMESNAHNKYLSSNISLLVFISLCVECWTRAMGDQQVMKDIYSIDKENHLITIIAAIGHGWAKLNERLI